MDGTGAEGEAREEGYRGGREGGLGASDGHNTVKWETRNAYALLLLQACRNYRYLRHARCDG